jgi:hypothetical protein
MACIDETISFDEFMMNKVWIFGLIFFTFKLFYSATYLGLKYSKIDPKEQSVAALIETTDHLYLGLLLGNLIILLIFSICS